VIITEIARPISLWQDVKTLYVLTKLFRGQQFSIMHSTTPKAGLLAALAAKLAGIPVRLHTFTGQIWLTKRGLMRWFLQKMDQVIVNLNTHCYTDSPSQKILLVNMGITDCDKVSSYGKGSLAGVDLNRFSQKRFSKERKNNIRNRVGVKNDTFVLAFIGRLTRDKGVYELLSSLKLLIDKGLNIELMMIGPMDDEVGLSRLSVIGTLPQVHWIGHAKHPEEYLAITDVLCLPSYREGFGTVVIEAAAMGVPTVGTEIPGLIDAVEHGVTGLLVPPCDVSALAVAIETIVNDRSLLKNLSLASELRCKRYFDSNEVNDLVAREYVQWLEVNS